MNWEVEDYRPKKPLQDPGPWLTWAWPKDMVGKMIFRLLFWTIALPFLLFGAVLSPVGFLLQIVVIDYFTWLQYKNSNTI